MGINIIEKGDTIQLKHDSGITGIVTEIEKSGHFKANWNDSFDGWESLNNVIIIKKYKKINRKGKVSLSIF